MQALAGLVMEAGFSNVETEELPLKRFSAKTAFTDTARLARHQVAKWGSPVQERKHNLS